MRTRVMTLALGAAAFAGCGDAKESNTAAVTTTRSDSSTTVSPSSDAAEGRGTSMVRFVNAVSASGALDVMTDSVSLFTAVEYGSVTAYREVRDNIKAFSLRPKGRDAQLIGNTETMRDGGRYTIVALPDRDGGTTLRIMKDDLATDSGRARIRVVNAAPGNDDMDIVMIGRKDALFDDIDYGTEAGFKDVDPTETSFAVRREDSRRDVATVKRMQIMAGRAYTIVLAGNAGGALRAISFSDEFAADSASATTSRDTNRNRSRTP